MNPSGSLGVTLPVKVQPDLGGIDAAVKRLRELRRMVGAVRTEYESMFAFGKGAAVGLKFTLDKASIALAKAEIQKIGELSGGAWKKGETLPLGPSSPVPRGPSTDPASLAPGDKIHLAISAIDIIPRIEPAGHKWHLNIAGSQVEMAVKGPVKTSGTLPPDKGGGGGGSGGNMQGPGQPGIPFYIKSVEGNETVRKFARGAARTITELVGEEEVKTIDEISHRTGIAAQQKAVLAENNEKATKTYQQEFGAARNVTGQYLAQAKYLETLSRGVADFARHNKAQFDDLGRGQEYHALMAKAQELELKSTQALTKALKAETAELQRQADLMARKDRLNLKAEGMPRSLAQLVHGGQSIEEMQAADALKGPSAARRAAEDAQRLKVADEIRRIEIDSAMKQQRLADKPYERHMETARKQGLIQGVYDNAARNPAIGLDAQSQYATKATEAFVRHEKAMARASIATQKLDETNRYLGRNMIQNIKHVTAWTSSVAILYGTIALLRRGVGDLVDIQFQQARLQQVLNGGYEGQSVAAAKLTDQVLRLASANGRSAKEAMDSAIQWSRLGMTRVEVSEAVRVSLMAANVAEITAGEATEKLSAITVTYGLRAKDLSSVLGMLNAVSNSYNVTNADMLDGITKTASVAKQAGVPLSELIGILGGTVGASGQSGANIGNAVKSIVGRVVNPEVQKMLREQFKFEATVDGGEDIKSFSEILREMYIHMHDLSRMEQQTMLFTVAGRNQASRMQALLDNYVKTQILAVVAMRNMNSAENENALITATLKNEFQGVATEFARFAALNAPTDALSSFAKSFKDVMNLMNKAPALVTPALTLLTAFGARLALTGFMQEKAMKDQPMKKGEQRYLRSTLKAGAVLWQDLREMTTGAALSGGGATRALFPEKFPLSFMTGADNSQEGMKRMLGARARNPQVDSVIKAATGTSVYKEMMKEGADEYFSRTGKAITTNAKALDELTAKSLRAASGTKEVQTALRGVGVGMKALGIASAVGELVVFAAVIYGLSKAFNFLYDTFALGSEKSNQAIGKLGEQAEFAKGAAEAAKAQARLIETVYETTFRAMKSNSGSPDALADQIAQAQTITNPGAANDEYAADKAKQEADKRALSEMIRLKNVDGLLNEKAINQARVQEQGLKSRIEQYKFLGKQLQQQKAELERIDKFTIFSSQKSRDEKKQGIRDSMDSQKMQMARLFFQDMEDFEKNLADFQERSLSFKVLTSSIQAASEAFKELYHGQPGDNDPAIKAGRDLLVLQAELDMTEKIKKASEEKMASSGIAPGFRMDEQTLKQKTLTDQILELEGRRAELEQKKIAVNSSVYDEGQGTDAYSAASKASAIEGEIQATESKIKELVKESDKVGASITTAKSTDGYEFLEKTAEDARKEAQKLTAEIEKQKIILEQVAIRQSRSKVIDQYTDSLMEGARIGENPGEQMANERAAAARIASQAATARIQLQAQQNLARVSMSNWHEQASVLGTLPPGPQYDRQRRDMNVTGEQAASFTEDKKRELQTAEQQEKTALLRINELEIQAATRLNTIERDRVNLIKEQKREMDKMLMTAGPGQILKMLALQKLGGKDGSGINSAGSFFALSSDTRQMAMQGGMFGGRFNPEVQRLNEEQGDLEGKFGRKDLAKLIQDHDKMVAQILALDESLGSAAGNIGTQMTRLSKQLAEVELSAFSKNIISAKEALGQFIEKLNSFTPPPKATAPPPAQGKTK